MPPRRRVSDLDNHLGYWLRMVSNAVSHAFAARLAKDGVTVAEWVFLRKLYDVETRAPTRLAGDLGMTKGAISKLADRLIGKGLVERTADPDDGRAHTLGLTRSGRDKVPRLAALADETDAAFFGDLEPSDRAALDRILRTLVERRGLNDVPTE
ncbi:MarR family winged helix-turn-helix transcriptional regulator [Microbaculum marinum]|uniref:MarR family transcriptional regulator n=1 Tax=Microbaculum marinum TaxID=1764581 RepID=A0AAW9RQY3_9HYPH